MIQGTNVIRSDMAKKKSRYNATGDTIENIIGICVLIILIWCTCHCESEVAMEVTTSMFEEILQGYESAYYDASECDSSTAKMVIQECGSVTVVSH